MTSSGSRPPESSQTSHRFTRWRVTSKFGFARLIPAKSSIKTRDALYRGPPIASQYSWYEARYAVGLRRAPPPPAPRPPDACHRRDPHRNQIEDLEVDEGVRLNRKDRNRQDALRRSLLGGIPEAFLLPLELRPGVLRVEEDREALVAARVTNEGTAVAVNPCDRTHHEQLRMDLPAPAPPARSEVLRTEATRHGRVLNPRE